MIPHEILRVNLSISSVIENRCSISRATNLWGKKVISLAIDRIRHCNERHGKVKNDSLLYSKIRNFPWIFKTDTCQILRRMRLDSKFSCIFYSVFFFLPKLYKSDSFKNFFLLREDTNFKIKISLHRKSFFRISVIYIIPYIICIYLVHRLCVSYHMYSFSLLCFIVYICVYALYICTCMCVCVCIYVYKKMRIM